jgi:hypothetical protein
MRSKALENDREFFPVLMASNENLVDVGGCNDTLIPV